MTSMCPSTTVVPSLPSLGSIADETPVKGTQQEVPGGSWVRAGPACNKTLLPNVANCWGNIIIPLISEDFLNGAFTRTQFPANVDLGHLGKGNWDSSHRLWRTQQTEEGESKEAAAQAFPVEPPPPRGDLPD